MQVQELFSLQDRVALVTGAAGHLGQSIVAGLCEAGAQVILNGRTAEKLEELQAQFNYLGYRTSTAAFDIKDETKVKELLNNIARDYKRLDIVVNNANSSSTGTMETANPEDFDQVYQINVTAPFNIVKLAVPLLEKTAKLNYGGTSVINITSMYGVVSPDPAIYGDSGVNSPPYYGTAKAGLIQLTRYMACHLASRQIRVNCISPGPFPPPAIKDQKAGFYNNLCRKNPMGRIGFADELKGATVFLASDASSYVTGINLSVDGGWTAW